MRSDIHLNHTSFAIYFFLGMTSSYELILKEKNFPVTSKKCVNME